MLKKTITYKDLDDNDITEDFYFNLNKAELAKMELYRAGGMQAYLQGIIDSDDGEQIIGAFENILEMSYGVRSDDGKTFMKSPEIFQQFKHTDAYAELFMELVTDAKASAEFITGLVPAGLAEEVKASQKFQSLSSGVQKIQDLELPAPKDYSKMTTQELMELPREELDRILRSKSGE